MHLHCLIREALGHAGSQLQLKKVEECQIAPSVGSREVLQASSPSTAYCVAALGGCGGSSDNSGSLQVIT